MTKVGRIASRVAVVVATICLAGCDTSGASSTTESTSVTEKLSVVTTTPILADFAQVIGGDRVSVYTVLKPNVDPHNYEPTAADITALGSADLIIKNGLGLESWFDDTMENADPGTLIVDASTGVAPRRDSINNGSEVDPHIWHSLVNAKLMVANIRIGLLKIDSAGQSLYQSNERAYDAQLDALRADIATSVSSLVNKNIVTNHDSLGYYIDEFGLNYVGSVIPSFDSQAELSSSDITNLVNKIKAANVKAIFTESSLPPKTAETISAEANVKVVGGDNALYGDSLGRPGSTGDTYLKMERHNTDVIVNSLI